MIRDKQMEDYVLRGTYQNHNGLECDVNIQGRNLYQCVKRLLDNDSGFSRNTDSKFMGGTIVPDYDVSASVNAIAKYI